MSCTIDRRCALVTYVDTLEKIRFRAKACCKQNKLESRKFKNFSMMMDWQTRYRKKEELGVVCIMACS